MLITGGSIAGASLFYRVIPNSYELTHLPEYAILSILMVRAIKSDEEKDRKITGRMSEGRKTEKTDSMTNSYVRSAVITCVVGSVDEVYQGLLPTRYFIWYDILLNGLGGLLGLMIVWGMSRK